MLLATLRRVSPVKATSKAGSAQKHRSCDQRNYKAFHGYLCLETLPIGSDYTDI